MATKLTDLQRGALTAAAARGDKRVQLPPTLRGAQLRKVGEKLIEMGYVREAKAGPTSPVWCRDDATGAAYALKLTAAGTKAAKETEKAGAASRQSEPQAGKRPKTRAPSDAEQMKASEPQPEVNTAPPAPERKSPSGAPRSGSKIAEVIAMLERESGATLSEMIEVTGWLSHTTRAALTGLRKRGYAVVSDRSDRERGSVYRIERRSAAAESGRSLAVAEAP